MPLGTEDITIVAKRPTLTDAYLEGLVVFAGEELQANVKILLWRVYNVPKRINSGSTIKLNRATGTFHHGPIAAGTYRITALQGQDKLGSVEGIVVRSAETIVAPDLTLD